MAISTPTALTSGSSTSDLSTYTSASVSPTAGRLLVLFGVAGKTDGTTALPTSIGGTLGASWSSRHEDEAISSGNLRGFAYTATAPAASGTVTMTFSGAQHNCSWFVIEIAGADTTTPVIQTVSNQVGNTNPITATFGSAMTSGSAVLACASLNTTTFSWNAGTGYTEFGTEQAVAGPTQSTAIFYDLTSTTSVSASASGGTASRLIMALEIAEADAAVSVTPNDATHVHSAESPAITQVHVVAPADGAHAHGAESPTIVYTVVVPNDGTHAHAAESPAITQVHVVAPADATHGHTAESPAVSVPASVSPNDASHAHSAESPLITAVHEVEPDDSTHAHTADEPQVLVVTPAPVPPGRVSTAVAGVRVSVARTPNTTTAPHQRVLTAPVGAAQRTSRVQPHTRIASA